MVLARSRGEALDEVSQLGYACHMHHIDIIMHRCGIFVTGATDFVENVANNGYW